MFLLHTNNQHTHWSVKILWESSIYWPSLATLYLPRVQLGQGAPCRRCQITFGPHCAWLFHWWADLIFTEQLTLVIWINLTPSFKQSHTMMEQWLYEEKTHVACLEKRSKWHLQTIALGEKSAHANFAREWNEFKWIREHPTVFSGVILLLPLLRANYKQE